MAEYLRTKGVEGRLLALLRKLKIQPETIFSTDQGSCLYVVGSKVGREGGHHYYVASAFTKDQVRVIIKVRIDQPVHPRHIFIRQKSFFTERQFYKQMPGHYFIPHYVDSGKSNGLEWLMYEFIDGQALGTAFLASDTTTSLYIEPLSEVLSRILALELPKTLKLETRDSGFYKEHLSAVLAANRQALRNYLTEKQKKDLELLAVQVGPLLDASAKYASHGDLHPGNVLLHNGTLSIIDWENIHLDNPLLDLAFLWLRLWNIPWRDRLLKLFFQVHPEKENGLLFRYLVLHRLLGELMFWHGVKVEKDKNSPYFGLADKALAVHQKTLTNALENPDFLAAHLHSKGATDLADPFATIKTR